MDTKVDTAKLEIERLMKEAFPGFPIDVRSSADDTLVLCVRVFNVPEDRESEVEDFVFDMQDQLPDGTDLLLLPMVKTIEVTKEHYPQFAPAAPAENADVRGLCAALSGSAMRLQKGGDIACWREARPTWGGGTYKVDDVWSRFPRTWADGEPARQYGVGMAHLLAGLLHEEEVTHDVDLGSCLVQADSLQPVSGGFVSARKQEPEPAADTELAKAA